ncbi:MAG: hypothetical protein EHM46_05765, partial [Bacteroidetes bacterium]
MNTIEENSDNPAYLVIGPFHYFYRPMAWFSRNILTFSFACLCAASAAGQEQVAGDIPSERLWQLHDSVTAAYLQFICGPLYADPYGRNEGNQFLGERGWQRADLVIGGRTCRDVPVKYDLCSDQLIYNHNHPSGNHPIALHKQRIGGFTIEGMHFVRFPAGMAGTGEAEGGFYQEIITGKAGYYVRWRKHFKPHTSRPGGDFILSRDAYVLRCDGLHRVRNRRDLAGALGDREREMRNYMRRNHLVIRLEDGSGLDDAVR